MLSDSTSSEICFQCGYSIGVCSCHPFAPALSSHESAAQAPQLQYLVMSNCVHFCCVYNQGAGSQEIDNSQQQGPECLISFLSQNIAICDKFSS